MGNSVNNVPLNRIKFKIKTPYTLFICLSKTVVF